MVIPEPRARLHRRLEELISGQITTWEFDRLHLELESSEDRAVAIKS